MDQVKLKSFMQLKKILEGFKLPAAQIEDLFTLAILLGLSIALAPVIGVYPIALISIVTLFWTIAIGIATIKNTSPRKSFIAILFCVSVAAAMLHMAGLGIAQALHSNDALYWNNDNKYFATLARSIAVYGGLSNSLEFNNASSMYHAGPSWIAGALNIAFDLPINRSLFLVFPAISIIIISAAGYRILRNFGFSIGISSMAVAISLAAPHSFVNELSSIGAAALKLDLPLSILSSESYIFTIHLMLNSLLALAIGMSSLALFTSSVISINSAILAATGIASLIAIKPQYFIGFMIAIAPLAFYQIKNTESRKVFIVLIFTFCFSLLCFMVLNSTERGSTVDSIVLGNYIFTRGVYRASWNTYGVLAGLSVFSYFLNTKLHFLDRKAQVSSMLLALGCLLLFIIFAFTSFPYSLEGLGRAQLIGLELGEATHDIHQGIVVTSILATITGAALLGAMLSARPFIGRVSKPVVLSIVSLFILSRIFAAILPIYRPTSRFAYEWSNEKDLLRLFQKNNPKGIFISSDLADSSDNHSRGLRGTNLTSVSNNPFYISNLRYGHYLSNGAHLRLAGVKRFFETPWSSWHDNFLRENNINFILVSDRCPPAWGANSFRGLSVDKIGRWSLLHYDANYSGAGARLLSTRSSATWPRFKGKQYFGLAPCFSFASWESTDQHRVDLR